ncbi:MAG: nucleotide sugar dehydrogenase, partial [Nitrososphaeraceae archaeon]
MNQDILFDNNISQLLLSLDNKIRSGEFKIAIYGLGHVGSPIAAAWLRSGAHVIGVDKSKSILQYARGGKTHIPEPGVNEAFEKGINNKKLSIYDDLVKASKDSFLKMICVPVLAADGTADLSAVKNVAVSIGRGLKKNDVVAINPSVPPGTTEEVVIPILQKNSGLTVEKDFYIVYNPERIYEGRAIEDIEQRYPGIV